MKNDKEIPQITATEVTDWENKFREAVSTLVKFDKLDNGYSMKFYNGESGIDAYWSGTIILKADNYLKWSYSVLNGVFMDAKLNLDDTNKVIPGNLYDFFKAWQQEVAKAITEPGSSPGSPANDISQDSTSPLLSGPETTNAPKPDTTMPITEGSDLINLKINTPNSNRRNVKRESDIMDSAERMRKLAGLK